LNAMKSYPLFWESIRENTLDTKKHNEQIREGLQGFKALYPDLTHSTIYYTMGVFRSPGTGYDSISLIGSEFALGDRGTVTKEFPDHLSHLASYYELNPIGFIQFSNVHEYVHTQQNEIVNNLLSQCLYEGIAEFVAMTVTKQNSPWQAFVYGSKNDESVKMEFEKDMFNVRKRSNWLWNNTNNIFETSDMGYYVGSQIAKVHYEKATDKKKAIKEMIELDYSNEIQIEKFVNDTKYLSAPLEDLYNRFEENRPIVTTLKPFENGSQYVKTRSTKFTIGFSKEMDLQARNFDYGPLGADFSMRIKEVVGFSPDGKTFTFTVQDLKPNAHYQLTIGSGFRDKEGNPLKPYLIEFKTTEE